MSEKELNELDKLRKVGEETYKKMLDQLSDDQRLCLFNNYCKHCGRKDPRCQCWHDE